GRANDRGRARDRREGGSRDPRRLNSKLLVLRPASLVGAGRAPPFSSLKGVSQATLRPSDPSLERSLREIGRELVDAMPRQALHPVRRLEQRAITRVAGDAPLRAAV